MKKTKIVCLSLLLSLVLTAAACGNQPDPAPKTEPKTASAAASSVPESKQESSAPESKAEPSAPESSKESPKTSTIVVPAVSEPSEESASGKRGIRPFEGLKISFLGTAPYLTPVFDARNCTAEVQERVVFSADPADHLRNGDTIRIMASLSGYSEDGDTFLVDDTWEYLVTDQKEYVTSLSGKDLSAMHKDMEDKAAAETAASKGDGTFGSAMIEDYFDSVQSKTVKESYLLVLKKRFEEEESVYNRYIRIFDYLIKEESGITEHVYLAISSENVTQEPDGSLTYEGTLEYDSSTSLDDLVAENVTSMREYYDVEKL